MTGHAYGTLAMNRAVLRIDPGNPAGEAVARAAGFHLTDAPLVARTRADDRTTALRIWLHHRGAPYP